jgi:cytochrome c-type biogenesis protein
MDSLFTLLNHAVAGPSALALIAAFAWGILSLILSPCHLASIPLIVGFIGQQGTISARRAFGTALLFASGILLSIALVGAVTAAAGRMMGDLGRWGNYGVALVLLAVGLHLLGLLPSPWRAPGEVGIRRRGLLAAFVLGLLFGIALGPCTFAFMAPVLGLAFQAAAASPVFSVLLLLCYGVGHCAVIVLAGSSTQAVQRYLDWNEKSRGSVLLRGICGILVLAYGAYFVWTAR